MRMRFALDKIHGLFILSGVIPDFQQTTNCPGYCAAEWSETTFQSKRTRVCNAFEPAR